MVVVLFAAFIIVPILELAVIIQVGSSVGVFPTLALLVLVSVAGAWLVRHQGTGVLTRIRQQLSVGELPTDELVNGVLILVAGTLMLTPGFLSDAVGLSLLIPPIRAVIRRWLGRRFTRRVIWDIEEI
ncbi:MAG: FxsA family protein [Actinomycetia bacterium]|nr:FxsA family protein [Actinomycetes bacterium]MCP4961581.1 FxsA family protein [Actinomycetes bacterium]